MADQEKREIVYVISAENSDAVAGMKAVSESTKGMGVAYEGAGLKTAGLRVAMHELGGELGLHGPLLRTVSHEVGGLSSVLGTGAGAFAVVVMAGIAVYKVYEHFAESAKKAREESIKAADASVKWVDQARVETTETAALREEKERMFEIDKRQNELDLEKGIKAQTEAIETLYDTMEKRAARANTETSGWQGSVTTRMIYGTKETRKNDLQQAEIDYDRGVAKLSEMYSSLDTIHGKNGGVKRKTNDPTKEFKDTYNAEAEYIKATDALWGVEDQNYQGHLDMQLAAFDSQTTAKLTALSAQGASSQRLRDEFAVTEIQRETLIAKEKDRLRQEDLKKEQAAAKQQMQIDKQMMDYKINSLSSGLDVINSITNGKYKEIFYLQKGLAAANAIIHGEEAAMAALAPPPLGLGPVFGTGLAAWARIEGYSAAAAIMAQAFTGGSGGGGATGVYSANPNTGLPTGGNPYQYFNYEQSTYGSGWKPGTGPQGSQQINIYAMDSKDVMRVLTENPKAVGKAMNLYNRGFA